MRWVQSVFCFWDFCGRGAHEVHDDELKQSLIAGAPSMEMVLAKDEVREQEQRAVINIYKGLIEALFPSMATVRLNSLTSGSLSSFYRNAEKNIFAYKYLPFRDFLVEKYQSVKNEDEEYRVSLAVKALLNGLGEDKVTQLKSHYERHKDEFFMVNFVDVCVERLAQAFDIKLKGRQDKKERSCDAPTP